MGWTFRKLYEEELHKPTPASLFIKRMAEVSGRSEYTVQMWLRGLRYPDKAVREAISKELGRSADELFPK